MAVKRVVVRPFGASDRQRVRDICCETAFLGMDRRRIFSDDEVLADTLIGYYTDYEPGSCFVACDGERVIGYIVGACRVERMNRVFMRVMLPRIIKKAVLRGVFCKGIHLRFFLHCFLSLMRGEFLMPDYTRPFPATAHINIDAAYRGQGIGRRLMAAYLACLKGKGVHGVHCATLSEDAGAFFSRMGFSCVYKSSRSYLRPYRGGLVPYWIFGREV